jgi:hypothetical protein
MVEGSIQTVVVVMVMVNLFGNSLECSLAEDLVLQMDLEA